MLGRRDLAEVRDLADLPQLLDGGACGGEVADLGIAGQGLERQQIGIGLGAGQSLDLRGRI